MNWREKQAQRLRIRQFHAKAVRAVPTLTEFTYRYSTDADAMLKTCQKAFACTPDACLRVRNIEFENALTSDMRRFIDGLASKEAKRIAIRMGY